ncbi:MAG: cation-translocating P-type ATPase [Clostridiaceae bacterium]|jgi:Ca2+-transporting ATPase|nr:cation-translocating P-type ATPase [Bacillota bacterium]NLI37810.1 cation-translocating P-type ATPase [Clostridiaceae bacterium]
MDNYRNAAHGLTGEEANKRLEIHGRNVLKPAKRHGWLKILFSQFTDLMIIILIASSIISFTMGENSEGIAILAIILLNGLLGFIQEMRTEKAMEALMSLAAPHARVVRDGVIRDIPAEEVVPGDLIVLEAGNRVPADAVLLEANNLYSDESMLTGESIPVAKIRTDQTNASLTGVTSRNMVYMGSMITNGTGRALVMVTGMETEMGKIAEMMETAGVQDTPLQKKLEKLGEYMVTGCLAICAIVAVLGILRGEPVIQMLLGGISLAVAAVPEGLPAVVTIALAIGVRRMVQKNALIRRLPAVETLGCATVICSDKTGTLTENRMTVVEAYAGKNPYVMRKNNQGRLSAYCRGREVHVEKTTGLKLLLKIGMLCGNTRIMESNSDADLDIEGDPTEVALVRAAIDTGLDKESVFSAYRRVREIPFDSERKLMSVICRSQSGELFLFAKGAPEIIMDKCSKIMIADRERDITQDDQDKLRDECAAMTSRALRVMAFAYRTVQPYQLWRDDLESQLVFIGLAGMTDPPRKEAIESVAKCRRAGIKTIMITGDHVKTATSIAKSMDIYRDGDLVVNGREIDQMSDQELEEACRKATVFARVFPKHKMRIVRAIRNNGNIVAMTGDGVNDAPAVKDADIGIAMGKSGTDVTRQAASMILMDDNFSSIVAAVEEGRNIYSNIRKFIRYLLSCNVGEVLTMFLSMIMGLPIPLLPAQVLAVNLATDGLPAIALGMEPGEPDIMERPPRSPDESIFSHGLARLIMVRGIFIAISTIASFMIVNTMSKNLAGARTAALVTLVLSQLIHVFECKSEHKSLFELPVFSNKYLIFAVLSSILMLLGIIYLPFLSAIFGTTALALNEWLIAGGISLLVPILVGIVGAKKTMPMEEAGLEHN